MGFFYKIFGNKEQANAKDESKSVPVDENKSVKPESNNESDKKFNPADIPVAFVTALGGEDPLGALDADDLFASAVQQMFHRHPAAGVIIAVHIGLDPLGIEQGVNGHHRDLAHGQIVLDGLIGGGNDDAVRVHGGQGLNGQLFLFHIVAHVTQEDPVTVLPGHMLDDICHLGKIGVFDTWNDQTNELRGLSVQASGHLVGDEVRTGNGLEHPGRFLGGHFCGTVDDAGNSGWRDTCELCHFPNVDHSHHLCFMI